MVITNEISTSRTWSKSYSNCRIRVESNIQILDVFNIPRKPNIKHPLIHIHSINN